MRSVEFARNHGVRLHVRSSFTWEPGTWVQEEDPSMEQAIVSAVVHDTSEAKVTVAGVPDQPGIAARLFRSLADADVNVDMIVQNVSDHGITDISFTVPQERPREPRCRLPGARRRDRGAGGVITDGGIAKVSAGRGGHEVQPRRRRHACSRRSPRHGINIEMISTSPIRISCVVRAGQVEEAVQALHDAFALAG